jgi:two-component system response regulator HydG
VTIYLPPLRERREDIPLLMHHFMRWAAERYSKKIDAISPEAQQRLMSYAWPGNVRQLRNVVENMVVLTQGSTIHADVIPPDIIAQPWRGADNVLPGQSGGGRYLPVRDTAADREAEPRLIDVQVVEARSVPVGPGTMAALPAPAGVPGGLGELQPADFSSLVGISIEQAERELIRNTLRAVNGNREQAAKILGIGERTLYRKIKEYAIES